MLHSKVDGWIFIGIAKMGWESTQSRYYWCKLCYNELLYGWVICTNKQKSNVFGMTLQPSDARYLCLNIKVTGEHVIVAKNTSSFANDQVPLLLTPLQPPQFLLKVDAHSSGPNLTLRSETKQSEYVYTTMQSLIFSSIWKMFKNDARKTSSDYITLQNFAENLMSKFLLYLI